MKTFFEKLKTGKNSVWLLILPLAVFFYFGFQHIAKFETADEHYWMYSNTNNNNYWVNNNGRIQQYWTALAKGDWKKTRINDKPGITLAWIGGPGAWLKTRLEADLSLGVVAPMSKMEKAELVNWYFRVPLLLFNGFFIFVFFYLLKRFFKNNHIALLSSTLILLSPIVVGISQIVNPDSLLWEFGFAALLSFLIFMQDGKRKFIFLTGLFLGMSLLTKYTAMIFFPFFVGIYLMYVVANLHDLERAKWPKKIAEIALGLFGIFVIALSLYAVLMPDNLIEFRHFMKGSLDFGGMRVLFFGLFVLNLLIWLDAKYFQSIIVLSVAGKVKSLENFYVSFFIALPVLLFSALIVNTVSGRDLMELFKIPFDASAAHFFGKSITKEVVLRQYLPLTFSLTPLVLIGFFYASIKNFKKSANFNWFIVVGTCFIFVYSAALIVQKVSMTIRYGIMLYPIIITMAAIGLYQIILTLKKKWQQIIFVTTICVVSMLSLHSIKPFYFNYTNGLLAKKYVITDSWGYGGYEAAAKLNSLADIESARVWSDYNGVCVFVNGNCSANKLTMQNIRSSARKKSTVPSFEYFVSNRRGNNLSHDLWENLTDEYGSKKIFLLKIGNRPENFVKVYKNAAVDQQKFHAN